MTAGGYAADLIKASCQIPQMYDKAGYHLWQDFAATNKNAATNRRSPMFRITTIALLLGITAAATAGLGAVSFAQVSADPNGAPNPYRLDADWLKIPDGRKFGQVTGVDIDPDGKSVWVFERCGARDCVNSTLNPIDKFDASGKLVASFGQGHFNHPHGFHVDRQGNVWATDNTAGNGKGHVVIKFSPEGKVSLTLGKPGVAGVGPDMFNAPTDVAVARNGDIIVSDGHGGNTNARIVKFTPDGKLLYVTNSAIRSVSAIDTKAMKVVANIPVGEVPKRINTLALR